MERRMVQGEREEEDLAAENVWKWLCVKIGYTFQRRIIIFPTEMDWNGMFFGYHGIFRFTKATGGWGKAITP